MPDQVLGGPIWVLAVALYVLAFGLALFCLVDSIRPRRQARLAELPEPAALYTVFFVVYAILLLGVWLPGIPRVVSAVPVILTPFALALGVAYLLRVVFPVPAEGAAEQPAEPAAAKPGRDKRSDDTAGEKSDADSSEDDPFDVGD